MSFTKKQALNFETEHEAKAAFFTEFYGELYLNAIKTESFSYTDGQWAGNLFEFKNSTSFEIEKVWKQLIRYAHKITAAGHRLPANLIGIDIKTTTAYLWKSADFIEQITASFSGAASKNIEVGDTSYRKPTTYDFSFNAAIDIPTDFASLITTQQFVPYPVCRYNIIGLRNQYYKYFTHNKTREDFIAEIKNPTHLTVLPYQEDSMIEFADILDCLNSKLEQREKGAFFTPQIYASIAQRMLLDRISEITSLGKNYIVLDRAAGTGNLFSGLPKDILEHCYASTLDWIEYALMSERISSGELEGLNIPDETINALEYDIIPFPEVQEAIDDPNTVVILFENPPYSEAGTGAGKGENTLRVEKTNSWKISFICEQMKDKIGGKTTTDLCNLFIWSGFEHYLSKQDYYILFSPIKYWKTQNIVSPTFIEGIMCNRKLFHATAAGIPLICWSAKPSKQDSITLDVIDEKNTGIKITHSKVKVAASTEFEKRDFVSKGDPLIYLANGGIYEGKQKLIGKPKFNNNVVAYMRRTGHFIDPKHITFTRGYIYNGGGDYLFKDNFLEKLPLFVASVYPSLWYESELCVSAECADEYKTDREFLKQCLFYTLFSFKNKTKSIFGIQNELAPNSSSLGMAALFELSNYFELTYEELKITDIWDEIVRECKECEEYEETRFYNPWQVSEDINLKDENGNKLYPELDRLLTSLKKHIQEYYKNNLVDKLKQYKLVI